MSYGRLRHMGSATPWLTLGTRREPVKGSRRVAKAAKIETWVK
jgi:hypothetical protein